MGVVTKYALGFKDPNSIALPFAANAEGRVRCIASGPIAVANGDSIASKVYFGRIPSSAIILPVLSTIYHTGLTGVTDFDIGIEHDGTVIGADILANGLDLHTAGSKAMLADVATTNLGKRLWDLAGASSNPGYEYDLVGTFNAAATAAGTISAFFFYCKK